MATPGDIERLRMIGSAAVLEGYDDAQLSALIDGEGGDVRRAAGWLWEQRAAQTSGFVDIREGSSARSMRQEHENALGMAAAYLGDQAGARKSARVHKIVRE